MHIGSQPQPPDEGGPGVWDGQHGDGMRRRHRQHQERSEQAPDAETGNRGDRTCEDGGRSNDPRGIQNVTSADRYDARHNSRVFKLMRRSNRPAALPGA
jgi:hypothetical protein